MSDVDDRWYVVRDGSKVPSSRHGKGKRWQATYRVGGREVTRSFDLKADAEAFLVTVGSEQLRGEYIDRSGPADRGAVRRGSTQRPDSTGPGRRSGWTP